MDLHKCMCIRLNEENSINSGIKICYIVVTHGMVIEAVSNMYEKSVHEPSIHKAYNNGPGLDNDTIPYGLSANGGILPTPSNISELDEESISKLVRSVNYLKWSYHSGNAKTLYGSMNAFKVKYNNE